MREADRRRDFEAAAEEEGRDGRLSGRMERFCDTMFVFYDRRIMLKINATGEKLSERTKIGRIFLAKVF